MVVVVAVEAMVDHMEDKTIPVDQTGGLIIKRQNAFQMKISSTNSTIVNFRKRKTSLSTLSNFTHYSRPKEMHPIQFNKITKKKQQQKTINHL